MTEENKNDENQRREALAQRQKNREKHKEVLRYDSDINLSLHSIHLTNAMNSIFQTVRLVSIINMFFIGAFITVYVYQEKDSIVSLHEIYTIFPHMISILLMVLTIVFKSRESNILKNMYGSTFSQTQMELKDSSFYFSKFWTQILEENIKNYSHKFYRYSYISSFWGYLICILSSVLSIFELIFQEPSTWYINRLDPGTFLNF